jgi:lipoprotein-releasing system ATP-binding protein
MADSASDEVADYSQHADKKDVIVSARAIEKVYPMAGGEVQVLCGLDLDVYFGETMAITGASGAGKSTLLHILGALDRPTGGEIIYKGDQISQVPDAELAMFRNREIGFVFQFHHLLPEFSALENVTIPGLLRGDARGELEERARSLIKRVGLSGRINHRPSELSGGEQQRVAIARALVNRPALILADEPTGNLDSGTANSIFDLMQEINRADGVTFLVATHNASIAARMNRQAVMVDGRIDAG